MPCQAARWLDLKALGRAAAFLRHSRPQRGAQQPYAAWQKEQK